MWFEQHFSRPEDSPLAAVPVSFETLEPRLLLSASTVTTPEMPLGDIAVGVGDGYMLFDEHGGDWVDVNKQEPYDYDQTPPGTGDDYLCWAAVISNMLGWTGWGSPVDGSGDASDVAESVFDYYQDHWADYPYYLGPAIQWWFDGVDYVQDGTLTQDGGGFFPDVDFEDIFEFEYDPTLAMYTAFTSLMSGSSVGLGASVEGANMGHIFTLWGFDRTDYGYTLYITDSDDDYDGLVSVDMEYDYYEGAWFLVDYYGRSDWYIDSAYALDMPELEADSREPDNTAAQATAISFDQVPVTQNLHTPSDVDWFRISLAEFSTLEISLNASEATTVDIYASNDLITPVSTYTDTDGIDNFVKSLDEGNYYLRVSSPNAQSTVLAYELEITQLETNYPPTVTLSGDDLGDTGDSLFFSASATDESPASLWYTWDFGDGSQKVRGMDIRQVNHVFSQTGVYTVSVTVSDGLQSDVDTMTVTITENTSVATLYDCHVFFNNTALDGRNPSATTDDDLAIAPGIGPLLPGESATSENISASSLGLNGIMIDIAGAPNSTAIRASDFAFAIMSADMPGVWLSAPAPESVTVRTGAGVDGTDRVTIIWEDNAIENAWLRVTPNESARTGLSPADAFMFGNLVGDVDGSGQVDLNDFVAFKSTYGTAGSFLPGDLNSSGGVDLNDFVALRTNFGKSLPNLTTAAAGVNLLAEAQAQPIRFAPAVAGALRRPGTQMLEN